MYIRSMRKQGFTLVEILIVIGIIALMAAIGIPNFLKARSSAQVRTCVDNLRQIDGAKQQWALEHRKDGTAIPEPADIRPYMGRGGEGVLPSCPNDNTHSFETSYTINKVTTMPSCKVEPVTHIVDL